MSLEEQKKRQHKLLKEGFTYKFQENLANEVSAWECILWNKGLCKAQRK